MTVLKLAVSHHGVLRHVGAHFYATDYSVFLPTRHNVIFPDGAGFCTIFAAYSTTDLIQPRHH